MEAGYTSNRSSISRCTVSLRTDGRDEAIRVNPIRENLELSTNIVHTGTPLNIIQGSMAYTSTAPE